MSEPKARARRFEKILRTVYCWHVQDERIGGSESAACAIVDDDGPDVLIDLSPAKEQERRRLGEITAIVLTAGNQPGSASGCRRMFGGDVYAPEDALKLEEQPDPRCSEGESLPNNLVVLPESPAP